MEPICACEKPVPAADVTGKVFCCICGRWVVKAPEKEQK